MRIGQIFFFVDLNRIRSIFSTIRSTRLFLVINLGSPRRQIWNGFFFLNRTKNFFEDVEAISELEVLSFRFHRMQKIISDPSELDKFFLKSTWSHLARFFSVCIHSRLFFLINQVLQVRQIWEWFLIFNRTKNFSGALAAYMGHQRLFFWSLRTHDIPSISCALDKFFFSST